jgi:YjbE family integral membrane protein
MTLELIGSIASIVIIDLVLSGDNALVIGMAAHRLPPRQRRWAIIVGGAGAIGLRVLFTALAAFLLAVPFLQALGGILLTWIAYKLLRLEQEEVTGVKPKDTFLAAVWTIVMADLVMSLDNMLAVGGAAHGSVELLLFGLILSMPILLFGSSLIARLLNRLPWLMIVGSVVLTITAARMVTDDRFVRDQIPEQLHLIATVALALLLTLVALIPVFIRRRTKRVAEKRERERDRTIPATTRE